MNKYVNDERDDDRKWREGRKFVKNVGIFYIIFFPLKMK